jgi:site-specific DNA-cytosine methylase
MPLNILSLFDGISCGQVALNRAGIKYKNYFASEIDDQAIEVTMSEYPNTIQLGDVKNLKGNDLPKIDLILAGSPCQGFSRAGNGRNFNDERSSLIKEFYRLRSECGNPYFLLENNKMIPEWEDKISTEVGVFPLKINSALVSAQNRERLYWTNIPGASVPQDKKIMLKDIIGEYDGIWVYPRGWNEGGVKHYKGKAPCVTVSSWQYNFFIYKKGEKVRFPIEVVEQLQTLPIGYTEVVCTSQRYKMVGNGWTVDVISHLLKGLKTKV